MQSLGINRIAVILPFDSVDYMADSILDGLLDLSDQFPNLLWRTTKGFTTLLPISRFELSETDFIQFAQSADCILFINNKYHTKYDLAEKVGAWQKTLFIDGQELGKNNRYQAEIQGQLVAGTYIGNGAINQEMLRKCPAYFRREKPYIHGIIPLPFGIERRYIHYLSGQIKDVDFTCIFGQDEYPPLRREATDFLETWCKKNNFTCATKNTTSLFNRDPRSEKSQEKFYDILARTKVGVSIGGGGFDTLRFWEILGNNCALLTEAIDIFKPDSRALEYQRIFQFKDLVEFENRLKMFGGMIKNKTWAYDRDRTEYQQIIDTHSTSARVLSIINHARKKGIIV